MTNRPKSMNFIRRLNRETFYSFDIWWLALITGIEVMKKYKISAQYL